MQPLRHLVLVAFAYEAGRGSEPGVGWNIAHALAKRFRVTVVTRPGPVLPKDSPVDVVRIGPPGWPERIDPADWRPMLQLYYYAWTRTVATRLPDIIDRVDADLVQHLTLVRYWMPSADQTAGRPFVWGPVGGGEGMPEDFVRSLPLRTQVSEEFRSFVRSLGDRDPAVRRTAQAADLGIAATNETANRMRRLTSAHVEVCPAVGIARHEFEQLAAIPESTSETLELISIGRLIDWKGYDLAVDALASLPPNVRYTLVGEGPRRSALEARAARLGVSDRITFTGWINRSQVLERLRSADALVHPSFHDSGGMVCLEAMAAGRPVVSLERNGPALLVGEAGLVVPAPDRATACKGLAEALASLEGDRRLLADLSVRSRERIEAQFLWERRAQAFENLYPAAMEGARKRGNPPDRGAVRLPRPMPKGERVG